MLDFKFSENDIYREIRPFGDIDIEQTVKSLKRSFLFRYFFDMGLKSVFGDNKNTIKIEFFSATSVEDIENLAFQGIQEIVSSADFNIAGITNLDKSRNYIFMSNHRIIIKDPLFINYALKLNGFQTALVGIGENLTKLEQIESLVRMNKCFIVRRTKNNNLSSIKKQFNFLYHALTNSNSIWIAQREGRAKDSNDFTDERVLKMLYMPFKNQGLSLDDFLSQTPIVPVTLSYEYDPCAVMKANELHKKTVESSYTKSKFEDIKTMWHELNNSTGRVTINFAKPIYGISDIQELASRIDYEIQTNYHLWPSNITAYQILKNQKQTNPDKKFMNTFTQLPNELKPFFIAIYANPYTNLLAHKNN
ncbi:MAG: 1-acyl-sn-glycerol-3-phosphate acyltransferase [Candidatus Woesearchaeota archaeon]